jgi:hypothetical protein
MMTFFSNQSMSLVLGQLVDAGRIAARVDRAAHQRHGERHELGSPRSSITATAASTGTDGWQTPTHGCRDRGVQHRNDVVDVIVEIEAAFGERHHAGVDPVGDVDLGFRQQRSTVPRSKVA